MIPRPQDLNQFESIALTARPSAQRECPIRIFRGNYCTFFILEEPESTESLGSGETRRKRKKKKESLKKTRLQLSLSLFFFLSSPNSAFPLLALFLLLLLFAFLCS